MATALKFVADNAPKKKPMKEGEVEKPNPNDDYWRDANGLTDEYYEEHKKWLEQQKKKPMKESVKDQIKRAVEEVIREKKLTKAEINKKTDRAQVKETITRLVKEILKENKFKEKIDNHSFPKLEKFISSIIPSNKAINLFLEDHRLLIGFFPQYASMDKLSNSLPPKAINKLQEKLAGTPFTLIDSLEKSDPLSNKIMKFTTISAKNQETLKQLESIF